MKIRTSARSQLQDFFFLIYKLTGAICHLNQFPVIIYLWQVQMQICNFKMIMLWFCKYQSNLSVMVSIIETKQYDHYRQVTGMHRFYISQHGY